MANKFNSRMFSYHGPTKTYVAELSETGDGVFGPMPWDPSESGFIMVSEDNPKLEAMYIHSLTKKDRDGDVQVYVFKPTLRTEREIPGLEGTSVHILND